MKGGNEDTHRLRPLGADLVGALDLDVQNDVPSVVHGTVHVLLGSTVEVAYVLGILQKLVLLHHPVELLRRDEVVVDTVHLPRTGVTGGGGNGKIQVRPLIKQRLQHGAFFLRRRDQIR